MTTAFVLSGGGSLGAVQVGMLQALADRRITPDLLIGTSAGALNVAFLAGEGMWPDGLGELAAVWTRLRRGDIFPIQPAHEALALAGFRPSLCSNRGLRRLIDGHLTYRRLEDAAIPVHVVATDLITGMETLFSTGDAPSAILASCAIPGVFPPVARGRSSYVDGGLADNAAISQAVNLGADTIYVLPGGNACALTHAPTHPVAIALQALTLLIQNQLIRDVAHYATQASLIVLPPLCPLAIAPLDFARAQQLIDRARHSTSAWLDGEHHPSEHPERILALHDHRSR